MVIAVSFTKRLPPGAANAGRGTLAELMAKSKQAVEGRQAAMDIPTPTVMQGFGKLGMIASDIFAQHRAEKDLRLQQQGQRDLLAQINPLTGATPEQSAAMGQYDPELMTTLFADRAARQRAEADRDNFQPLTAQEAAAYGIDPAGYQRNIVTGDIEPISGKGGIKIDVGGETDKFFNSSDTESGKTWAGWEKGGPAGAAALNDINIMRALVDVAPQGQIPGWIADTIGPYTTAQAALKAIIQRNIPTLHVEGSGATSDLEFQSFAASLPNLSNLPGMNKAILEVMQQKAQIQQEMGDIASSVLNRQRSREEGTKLMQELRGRHLRIPPALQEAIAAETARSNGTPPPAPGQAPADGFQPGPPTADGEPTVIIDGVPVTGAQVEDAIRRRQAAGGQ